MIATKCNRCGMIGTCHCNGNVFKTIQENNVLINAPKPIYKGCRVIGQCFCSGECKEIIGYEDDTLINPPKHKYDRNLPKFIGLEDLLKLNKYHHDRYGDLEINDEGEYLLLSDVLSLFSDKK